MRRGKLIGSLVLMFFSLGVTGQPVFRQAEESPLTRILIVFDASQSMAELWQSDTKYRTAVKVLSGILDSLQGYNNLEIGLRVYGPKRAPGPDCEDSYIMVPFGKNTFAPIKSILNGLSPQGTTPIAYSLEETVTDFTHCDNCRNVVILISDGLEACNGDPCEVSRSLQQKGIFLRPFIVGIGENLQTQFNCIGNFYDASNEAEYKRALETIVATTLKGASAQVNLLDRSGNPTQTDVEVTLFNTVTGSPKYGFIHTLNEVGLPDTIKLDPLVAYDVVVQTIPPIRKENVWIEPGKHTTIRLDAAQGILSFISEDEHGFSCIIRKSGTREAIHTQSTRQNEKYLAGFYDITVLTMPRMNFMNVEIIPDVVTQLRIPPTGNLTVKQLLPMVGSIYMELPADKDSIGEMLWVDHLRPDQLVATFQLQPGNYVAIYRLKSSAKQSDTQEKRFTVEAGKNVLVEL